MQFKFKELDIKPEESWFKRTFLSSHAKKTAVYVLLGAVAGFFFFYFTNEQYIDANSRKELLNSVFFGAFIGFFLTNSPCARGRC